MLTPCVDRYKGFTKEERVDFRGQLTDYVRLYAFLSQILTFADADLEKLYVLAGCYVAISHLKTISFPEKSRKRSTWNLTA